MPDAHNDPSGNTAQFQAFVAESSPEPETARPLGLLVAGAVLAVVAIALVVWSLS
jgi:hypothetical protein